MEDFLEALANNRVGEVKLVLTVVAVALAFYQVFLMLIGYSKVKLPFLQPPAASIAHRSIGDAIIPIVLLVGLMCIGYFGMEDGLEDAAFHSLLGVLLAATFALKVIVVRWWHALGGLLPVIGTTLLLLLVGTLATAFD